LPVLPSEVTSPDDLFRCTPYRAVMRAGACVTRQDAASSQHAQRSLRWKPDSNRLRGEYDKCLACPLGQQVKAAIEAGT
jgi:hypothetical protein